MKIGQIIHGRYEIIDLLPSGGQADLGLAINLDTGLDVVVKEILTSSKKKHYAVEIARAKRCAQLRIGHPVIVDPIDSGEEGKLFFIIFPYIEGKQLDLHVQHHGTISSDQVIRITCELARGLQATHEKGVAHRDVKPANILIQPDGNPRIIDFGICKMMHEQTITTEGSMLGSLLWMPPEQLNSPIHVDHRADLYALGGITYFMLTGKPPVQGNTPGEVAANICQQMPVPPRQLNPQVPDLLDRVCIKLLAKNPADRFQSAKEIIEALQGHAVSSQAKHCYACGIPLQAAYQYCTRCGAPQQARQTGQRCMACGTSVNGQPSCTGCGKSFSPPNHRLEFISGTIAGVIFKLPEGLYVVGRDVLDPRNGHISRNHMQVICNNGSVQVQDAGSTNKTYVDQQLADQPIALRNGQLINIAGNIARYISN